MLNEHNHSFFEFNDFFFAQQGIYFSSQRKTETSLPFKDHLQLPIIVDVLSRKNCHHLILENELPPMCYPFFLESLVLYLNHDYTPYPLKGAELFYLDMEKLIFTPALQNAIEKEVESLIRALDNTNKYLLFALNNTDILRLEHKKPESAFLFFQLKKLMAHANCRFLMFSTTKTRPPSTEQATTLHLMPANETDIIALLKLQQTALEDFHHIVIPEELLTLAYSLAERYLSAHATLEKALLLLDSSAARTSAIETGEPPHQSKPVMTSTIITNVLSSWTQIPASHLVLNKFKLHDFMQGMQQRVFGQDIALTILGHELQQAQARLQPRDRPFCSLLFTGPEHAGKKTTAVALAEQLFQQVHAVYYAPSTTLRSSSLADMKLQRYVDQRYFQLSEAIAQTPYAIFIFDSIEQATPRLLDELQEILQSGYWHDTNGHHYNFRQAIIILCTTLGSKRLLALDQQLTAEQEQQEVTLMQLIMNEQKHELLASNLHHSPSELADEMLLDISHTLPAAICQYVHPVPFLRLDKTAIKRIFQLKLNSLGSLLHARFHVEFAYAPEVLHYLTHEALRHCEMTKPTTEIDKTLKPVYFVVEQAIVNQTDHLTRKQLFLQLNDTGTLLRCDWLAIPTVPVRHHPA